METTNFEKLVKNLLESEYSNIKTTVGEMPDDIRVYPWDCSLGHRLDSLELRRWSAEKGWEYLQLPTETKQVNAWGRNGDEYSEVEYFSRKIVLKKGVYALIHTEKIGDWEVPDDPEYDWSTRYSAWVWEV